jgi:hypothetical protein
MISAKQAQEEAWQRIYKMCRNLPDMSFANSKVFLLDFGLVARF